MGVKKKVKGNSSIRGNQEKAGTGVPPQVGTGQEVGGTEVFTPEEEEKVKKRLEALGYL